MDKIRIHGGNQLNGDIEISGANNAALPLQCAAILTDQPLVLTRVPDLKDVLSRDEVLEQLGCSAKYDSKTKKLTLHAPKITSCEAPYELVRKMRASILVLGPLVARHGEAKVSLPGGCAIGTRPVDLHIEGLKRLGAEIELHEGYIHAKAPKGGLVGAAVAASVGQSLGAGDTERARRAGWSALQFVSAIGAVMALVTVLIPEQLASLFTTDAAVIAEAARYLRIAAFSQLFLGAEVVLESAMGGAGWTLPPMLGSTAITALRIPVGAWAAAQFGTTGLWWTLALTAAARGVLMAALWGSGRWRRVVV